jgi:hypothetical protein
MTLSKSTNKQEKCIHYWMIDTPDGSMSYSRCKRCGAVAEFSNIWMSDFADRKKPPNNQRIQHIK